MWIQPLIFKGTLSRDYLLITNERTETFQFSKYAELVFDFLNLVIETAFGDAQRAVAAAALKSVSNGNNLTALKQLKGKMRLCLYLKLFWLEFSRIYCLLSPNADRHS